MADLIIEFAKHVQHVEGLAPLTADTYARALARLSSALEAAGVSLESATLKDLESILFTLVAERGVSKRTRFLWVVALRRFYGWLFSRDGRRPENNPAKNLRYPKRGFALPRRFDGKYLDRLFAGPDLSTFFGVRDIAMLLLLVGCGLRVSEVCKLNEGDLLFTPDPAGGFDFVDLRVIGKGGRPRIVSAPKECGAAIRAYLGHPELRAVDRYLPGGDQVLFISTRKRQVPQAELYGEALRIGRRAVYEIVRVYGRRARVPADQIHPHALRHLYACHLLEGGVDLYLIKEMLGHASITSTQIYLEMVPAKRREIAMKKTPLNSFSTPLHELVRQSGHK